jgi:hypothetical protein
VRKVIIYNKRKKSCCLLHDISNINKLTPNKIKNETKIKVYAFEIIYLLEY